MSKFKQKLRMPLDSLSLCLAFTLESSLDNFRAPSRDEELITGTLEIVICYPRIILKFYMLVANLLPALVIMSPDNLIFVDTGVAVLVCYVLLLDINWSFIWLAIFPSMAIIFIYALSQLYRKAYSRGGEHPEEAGIIIKFREIKEGEVGHDEASRGSSSTGESRYEKTSRNTVELEFIGVITFGALWAMDQLLLDEHPTHRFTISQFLLFLSFMLAILTCMMMRLPAGVSPGIAPASELLHKTLLVLLLVTAHTVAAEALGEEVVLICMPEIIPAVLIWFSIHHGSLSGNDLEAYKKWRILLPPVIALAFAIMDESVRPGCCTTILVYCAVSGFLAHYVVFMLSHWPGQQPASKQDPVKLLKFWANDLLIAAASSLLLRYVLVSGLGRRGAIDALRQNFQRFNLAVKGETKTFWSIMPLVCSALFYLWSRFSFENNNLWRRSRNLHAELHKNTILQKVFGFCYNVFLLLHMFCFTDDASRILSTIVLHYFGKV